MDQVMQCIEPGKQFAKDSIRLVKRCTKPDRKGGCDFWTRVFPAHLGGTQNCWVVWKFDDIIEEM